MSVIVGFSMGNMLKSVAMISSIKKYVAVSDLDHLSSYLSHINSKPFVVKPLYAVSGYTLKDVIL